VTPCLESLLTRRDRDLRGGWLWLLMPALNNSTPRGRQHVQTLDLGERWSSGLWSLETSRLHSSSWHSTSRHLATSRCPSPQRILGSGQSRVFEQARARAYKHFVHLVTHKVQPRVDLCRRLHTQVRASRQRPNTERATGNDEQMSKG
jgi:hypothetical protein